MTTAADLHSSMAVANVIRTIYDAWHVASRHRSEWVTLARASGESRFAAAQLTQYDDHVRTTIANDPCHFSWAASAPQLHHLFCRAVEKCTGGRSAAKARFYFTISAATCSTSLGYCACRAGHHLSRSSPSPRLTLAFFATIA
uniref:Uncharacterized protein n=1 Tax=Haptolina ericina TaxID=156174 RepID=A0A7S3F568_9EUKA